MSAIQEYVLHAKRACNASTPTSDTCDQMVSQELQTRAGVLHPWVHPESVLHVYTVCWQNSTAMHKALACITWSVAFSKLGRAPVTIR